MHYAVVRWRPFHWFQSWPSGGATCKKSTSYLVASLGLLHIALDCPIGIKEAPKINKLASLEATLV